MDAELQNKLKKEAARKAASYVKNGMVVGLGSGSTVKMLVHELGRRVKEEDLQFTGVATSIFTAQQAKSLGIKIVDLDMVDSIDLTIDGADQVDSNFNGIKGGGGNLLWEKIVAINSKKIVWVVDKSKVVDTIGAFPLAVDVIPFGSQHVMQNFDKAGYEPGLTKKKTEQNQSKNRNHLNNSRRNCKSPTNSVFQHIHQCNQNARKYRNSHNTSHRKRKKRYFCRQLKKSDKQSRKKVRDGRNQSRSIKRDLHPTSQETPEFSKYLTNIYINTTSLWHFRTEFGNRHR